MEVFMARKSNKTKLNLFVEQKDNLIKLSQARTASFQKVQRSSILLKYVEGLEISTIAKELNTPGLPFTSVSIKPFQWA